MSAPSGKATIMIHLLKTHAVARKYYFAQDKCSYFFFLFLIKAAPVSVYKARPYIFYSSAQMTLALPAPQQLLRVVNLLFCEERFNIYVAADIQTHQISQPGGCANGGRDAGRPWPGEHPTGIWDIQEDIPNLQEDFTLHHQHAGVSPRP